RPPALPASRLQLWHSLLSGHAARPRGGPGGTRASLRALSRSRARGARRYSMDQALRVARRHRSAGAAERRARPAGRVISVVLVTAFLRVPALTGFAAFLDRFLLPRGQP